VANVAAGGPGVGVTHRILDVLQRHPRVVEARGEGVAQAVRAELAGGLQAGVAGEASDEPPGLRLVHPARAVVEEQRPAGAIAEIDVERAVDGRLERVAAALARDPQDAVALLVAEVLDVAREGLVDAQAVVGQQRDQRRRPPPVGLGAASSCSSSSRARPTVIELLATRGRLTFDTGFSSSTETSTP
jgi:hypothetical protein